MRRGPVAHRPSSRRRSVRSLDILPPPVRLSISRPVSPSRDRAARRSEALASDRRRSAGARGGRRFGSPPGRGTDPPARAPRRTRAPRPPHLPRRAEPGPATSFGTRARRGPARGPPTADRHAVNAGRDVHRPLAGSLAGSAAGAVGHLVVGLQVGRGLERRAADLAPRSERAAGMVVRNMAGEAPGRRERSSAEVAHQRGRRGHDDLTRIWAIIGFVTNMRWMTRTSDSARNGPAGH
jgi:hypothetical protein